MQSLAQDGTPALNESGMLAWRTDFRFNSQSFQPGLSAVTHYAKFSITDNFLHWPVNRQPNFVQRVKQLFFCSVAHLASSMPSSSTTNHVKNDVLFKKYEVYLYMLIESACVTQGGNRLIGRPHPHSAFTTCVDNVRDHVEDVLPQACSRQNFCHGLPRGVPPSQMQFSELASFDIWCP